MSSSYLYIISDYKFHKHSSLSRAQSELERLEQLWPDRHFRIYQVKSCVNRLGIQKTKNTKHDIKNDYKNPPWQKGPTEATPKEISLDCFRGKLLSKGDKNG